jgi:hypothetical protein
VLKKMLILCSMIFLTSCINRASNIEEDWTKSTNAFDSGNVDDAIKFAKRLGWYSSNKSDFLVGQYFMYAAAKNNLSFGNEPVHDKYYEKLESLDISDVDPSYQGHFIAAQAFAERLLHSEGASSKLLSEQCDRWFRQKPRDCVDHLLGDAAGIYTSDYSRLDALYLYEVARLGSDLNLASPQLADFYAGIAFLQIDANRANFIISRLHSRDQLSPKMQQMYCTAVSFVQTTNSVLECGK